MLPSKIIWGISIGVVEWWGEILVHVLVGSGGRVGMATGKSTLGHGRAYGDSVFFGRGYC